MIYLDSSALVKLLVQEAGSSEVESFIGSSLTSEEVLVTSRLTGLELSRFAFREGLPQGNVEQVMELLDEVDVTEEVIRAAKEIRHHTKSLDAIHLGTAELLQVDFLATFDKHLADVAIRMGIESGPLPS